MGKLHTLLRGIMSECKYTRIIHSRGWTVIAACEYWEIRYDVWRRKCRKDKKTKAQLLSMCRGLENKLTEEGV